ncbi:hypothetical protein MYCTH_2301073 [Thermothelomyces thermophilus ATCC 42464]|uniref:DUF7924 domain-containing protein n=1 Tax=Thermothelomyces thermophilus (strain ATCC 42464 / BCRC 31852 / DSM 1799) TaxID=573729 RepID=G2Q8W2_THET4|nr:uncharacterized protein MYCTH_2301073 [Thermothelomyces thermophilus ATCC 42464]AEO56307.1 hypothetical protein MYCTH_2301073 [Thermothelomyces thermophilus ATCC 42464]
MARTRGQAAAQKGFASPAPKAQEPQGIQLRKGASQRAESNRRIRPSAIRETPSQQDPPALQSKGRKRKQRIEPGAARERRGPKRQPISPTRPAGDTIGNWPSQTVSTMNRLLARKKSTLSRKRSNSDISKTPSDQKPREEKSAQYRDQRYETLLQFNGSYMTKAPGGLASASQDLCRSLLENPQPVPGDTLFQDDIFETTCEKIRNKNEARVIQDISRLIVPSAESLATFGAKHLDILIESVNEGWSNSMPLTGTRPQPDYSVGFRREAFTKDQLAKLSPCIGDLIAGDASPVMATYYMYFPFLTCEVKCGTAALDIADRQNAHSMTLAVRAIVDLFRAVKREDEVNRKILAFSISHDNTSVRIYGHYPVIAGNDTKYYRHPIHKFDFTALDGKDKWTAYRFTKNVYDIWMPEHFKNICSAIDQLPLELDVDAPPLSDTTTGLSQDLGGLMQSDAGSVSQDSQSSNARQQGRTPDTSFTVPGKRRKG